MPKHIPFRVYATLLGMALLGVAIFSVGLKWFSEASAPVTAKGKLLFVATPGGDTAFSYYAHVVGFMAFGLLLVALAFWFSWLVLFSKSSRREAVINFLSKPIRPGR